MTYRESWVEVIDDRDAPSMDATNELHATRVVALDPWMKNVSVRSLGDWAKRNNAQCRYTDNCWLQVPLEGRRLRAFAIEVCGVGEAEVSNLIGDSGRYMVISEEF